MIQVLQQLLEPSMYGMSWALGIHSLMQQHLSI